MRAAHPPRRVHSVLTTRRPVVTATSTLTGGSQDAEPNAAPDRAAIPASRGSWLSGWPQPLSLVVLASGKAWERGKRCNRNNSETFRRNPVGNQSHLVELACSQKRVLR